MPDMTLELAGFLVAVLALILSLNANIQSRKTAREQIRLQRSTDELARKQLEAIAKDEADATQADVDCTLTNHGRSERVVLTNRGRATAYDVRIPWLDQPDIFPDGETQQKLPIKALPAGKSVQLLAATDMSTRFPVSVEVSWHAGDNREIKKSLQLYPEN